MKRTLAIGFLLLGALLSLPQFAEAQQHTVSLSWTEPAAAPPTSSAAASYNVFSAPGPCGPSSVFSQVNTAPVTATTYVDASSYLTSTATTQTFCYQVTAVAAPVPPATVGLQSQPSGQVSAVIPAIAAVAPAPPVLAPPIVTAVSPAPAAKVR
jgi:hypothetical protein